MELVSESSDTLFEEYFSWIIVSGLVHASDSSFYVKLIDLCKIDCNFPFSKIDLA